MPSNINENEPTPVAGKATLKSIRDNFKAAKEEIEELQEGSGGSGGSSLPGCIYAPGVNAAAGPPGPHPRGTIWMSSSPGRSGYYWDGTWKALW